MFRISATHLLNIRSFNFYLHEWLIFSRVSAITIDTQESICQALSHQEWTIPTLNYLIWCLGSPKKNPDNAADIFCVCPCANSGGNDSVLSATAAGNSRIELLAVLLSVPIRALYYARIQVEKLDEVNLRVLYF